MCLILVVKEQIFDFGDRDGPTLAQRARLQLRRSRPTRPHLWACTVISRRPATTPRNASSFRAVGGREAVHEERVRLLRGERCFRGRGERSGKRSSSPATTESAEPSTSSRQSVAAAVVAGIRTRPRWFPPSKVRNRCGGGRRHRHRRSRDHPDSSRWQKPWWTSRPLIHRTMSKSWIEQSRKMPPECSMYEIGGGAGSRVVDRRVVDPTEFSGSNCVVRRHK